MNVVTNDDYPDHATRSRAAGVTTIRSLTAWNAPNYECKYVMVWCVRRYLYCYFTIL